MKSRLLSVFILMFTLIAGIGGEAFASPPSPEGQQWPVVTNLDSGLMLEWQIPFPSFVPQPDGSILVQLAGFNPNQQPGMAELPYLSRLIALPPGANPEISILEEVSSEMTLAAPLTVAPPTVRTRPDGTVIEETDSSNSPKAAQKTVDFQDLGDLRGVRLAQITIRPVLAQGNVLKIVSRIKVEVKFNAARLQTSSASNPVQNELAGMVINPQDIASLSQLASAAPQMVEAQPATAAIQVSSEGVYRINYADLNGIGFPIASVNPHNLHLTRAGVDIPFEWEGNSDNSFQSTEALVFYAQPRVSRWANYDVYFLSTTNAASLLIPSLNASIGGETAGTDLFEKTFEENKYYMPDCSCPPIPMGRDGDRWVWDQSGIQRNYTPTASRSFTFTMSNVSSTQSAELNVWLISYTENVLNINPDHRFQVIVNGSLLGTMEWLGKQAVKGTFTIPAGVLQATNTLTFNLPGITGIDLEGAWLDAFSIKSQPGGTALDGEAYFNGSGGASKFYQVILNGVAGLRVYDVTNPDTPLRLTSPGVAGTVVSFADKNNRPQPRFAVVTEAKVRTPTVRLVTPLRTLNITGANFVIISPDSLDTTLHSALNTLSGLVSLRQSQGLNTVIEDVQAIYDAYGGGIPAPQAIHAYLQDIYNRWNPRPAYVLLVGDGTVDPKKYFSNSFTTIIPPYLADFDVYSTEGATDNRFVTFGGPTDIIPDMQIGRLPVKTQAELTTELDKIVNYDAHPAPGTWKDNATIVAAMPDGGGNFTASGNLEAALLQCKVPVGRLFYPIPYTTPASVHNALISRWNAGTGMVIFNGHGSIQSWATYGPFTELFHYNDIAALTNGSKLPVVLDMTCFTGAYQTPGLVTPDEGLVLAANGGSLAAWGSTGLGLTSTHEYLAQGFIAAIVSQNNTRLGDAALQGKLYLLAKDPANSDQVDSFNLLGDPTSIFSLNDVQSCSYLPSVLR